MVFVQKKQIHCLSSSAADWLIAKFFICFIVKKHFWQVCLQLQT